MTSQHLMERTPVEALRADRGLLRAEFDALIAANFPDAVERPQRLPPRRAGAVAVEMAPWRPEDPTSHAAPTPAGTPSGHVIARERGPPGACSRRSGPDGSRTVRTGGDRSSEATR